jgi:spoIIIJ-associated protein
MDFVETEGETIDAAIENALKLLGVEREQVTVEIVSHGRKGILGFGSQKAKIRAEIRSAALTAKTADRTEASAEPAAANLAPDAVAIINKAHKTLEDILARMELKATVERKSSARGDEVILEIRAENSGLLIGRKGQTLEALQYLVTRIAGERPGSEGPHVIVDVENYRERRRRSLEDMALRLGEKAKRQRKTVTIDALSAADRRIIHAVLQDDPWVSTKSLGQGAYRRLLIIPEGDRRTKEEPQARRLGGRTTAQSANAAPQPEPADSDDENESDDK